MTKVPPRHKETWWWNRDVEKVVAKRKVCHQDGRKSKSAEDKQFRCGQEGSIHRYAGSTGILSSTHPTVHPRQTHTHPTYSTNSSHPTLIHNTSAALDTIHEPCAPPTCPALTTPHPSLTPALLSTSHHHTPSVDTHATQTTVHVSVTATTSST